MGLSHESLVSGERNEALTALRTLLAARLLDSEPGQAAGLAREFRAVLAELEQVRPVERSTSDDLTAKRDARRTAAKAAGSTG